MSNRINPWDRLSQSVINQVYYDLEFHPKSVNQREIYDFCMSDWFDVIATLANIRPDYVRERLIED
jgi:hypothetical protein